MSSSTPNHRTFSSRLSSGVVMALLLGISFPAFADEAPGAEGDDKVRYERQSGKKKVEAKETLDTKFKKAQAEADRDKNKKVEMMTADQFARQKEAVAQEIADRQIAKLTQLIKLTEPTDPQFPEYLFRLADLHLDKKAFFDRQAGSLYEPIYQAEQAGKGAEASQLKQKQKRFEAQAKAAGEDAVKVYHALVTNKAFVKYKRLDEALYFYAFELGQLKREKEMQAAFLRLIQDFPNSKYKANALLSFADFKFVNNQIQDALKLYQTIVDGYKDSPVYAYALYKMAWCHLNPIGTAEPAYSRSLDLFVQAIKATLEGRAGSEANARQLRRDSRRDLVKAYVHAGKPSQAWDFFTRIGNGPKKDENQARSMMETLANTYFGEGMYVESSATYKTLQNKFDNDPQRCDWQARVVVNALATDDQKIQWLETERLAQYWDEYRGGKFKAPVTKKCHDEARDTIRQMATVWHDEAEKTRRADSYDYSEKAYRAYMKYFPKDDDAYEMNYYYAEILWAQGVNYYNSKDRKVQEVGLKKFREAHDEFVRVLERNPKGKYTGESAKAQMLAMKNALEYDETGGKSKACKVNSEGVCVYKEDKRSRKPNVELGKESSASAEYPQTPYSDDEKAMLAAYDIYQKYVTDPKDEELPKIQYHRAKLMMEHNRFEEAMPHLEELVTKFDGSIYAAWASEMLVDALTIRWQNPKNSSEEMLARSQELETWAKKLQTMKVWTHKEADRIREVVPTLIAGIGWKQAEAYQEQGKNGDPDGYQKCAEKYVEIYNNFEPHDRADTLLFNAARCYEAAYLIGYSIKMRNTLLQRHPESQHYQQTLKELGENYQAIAFYAKAADRYEEYADKYTRDDFASNALQNAYLFRLGLGDEAKASQNLTKYEELYKRKDVATAAKIFWSKQDVLDSEEEKLAHARDYISTYGLKGGVDRRVVAEATAGQILWRQSCSKGLLYDSCITIERKKAVAGEKQRSKAENLRRKTKRQIPTHCGSATQGLVTVYPRDKKKAAEAQKHFQAALKLSSRKPDLPSDDIKRIEDYKNAVGMAMVYNADQKYEEYLGINIPENLDFSAAEMAWMKDSGIPQYERQYKEALKRMEESQRRFKEFFKRKDKLADELASQYANVKSSGSPYWTLAAAARSAIVNQNFADQLYRAEVPNIIKTEEQFYAYCDALADQATGPQERALSAFTYCLQRSTEFQFFNEFSRMCEEELQQRSPDEFPATNELFGTSVYTDSRLDVVGVQTDLAGDGPSLDTDKSTGTSKKGL